LSKYLITCLLTFALMTSASGQSDNGSYRQDLANLLNRNAIGNYGNGQKKVYNQDFSKNPFIFKEWQQAKLEFKDGKSYDSLMVNYDDKQGLILVTLTLGSEPFTLKTIDIAQFTFYDKPNRPFLGLSSDAFDEQVKRFSFYESVYSQEGESGMTVLKSYLKKYRDADQQVNYASVEDKEGKYDLYSRYYIKQAEGKYKRVSLGKKTIQSLIGKAKMKEAQRFLKANKLKWNDEQALVAIIESFL